MSKIKLCKKCSTEIPAYTKNCPNCGAKLKMGLFKKILLSVITIFIFLTIIGSLLPDDSSTTNLTKKNTSNNSSNVSSYSKETAKKVNSDDIAAKSSNETQKNTSNSPYDASFTKEESIFSPNAVQALYSKTMNYVALNSKLFSADYYKITLNPSDYIYYGDLKNNEPDGKGILLQRVNGDAISNHLYVPFYIGNFKNGNFNGFGYKYAQASDNQIVQNLFSDFEDQFHQIGVVYKEYEGYFKDGKFNGDGSSFQIDFGSILDDNSAATMQNSTTSNNTFDKFFTDNADNINTLKNDAQSGNSDYLISKLPPINSLISYSGDFSNDKLSGKGKEYGKNQTLIYDGNFSNNAYSGEGKLYYDNGKLKYSGNFLKGKYNGNGTLYNEDGSIKYSGQWSNGDIK